MQIGAFTGYFDVAQVTLYGFWIFFAGLVIYIRREDKREGHPMVTDNPRAGRHAKPDGFPPTPPSKKFLLNHGTGVAYSAGGEERSLVGIATTPYPGAPIEPVGNPMIDGIGPASWAMRTDEPDLGFDDHLPKIRPLRVATDFFLATEDPNPVGMPVVAADGLKAGICSDVWVDRSEVIIRYLECELTGSMRRVLIPMNLAQIMTGPRAQIRVNSITAEQFAHVPGLKHPDEVTLREEDQIMGYYGGGKLYATPERMGPLL